jgi:hypothetical protein
MPLSVYLVLSTETSRANFFQVTPANTAGNLVLLLIASGCGTARCTPGVLVLAVAGQELHSQH